MEIFVCTALSIAFLALACIFTRSDAGDGAIWTCIFLCVLFGSSAYVSWRQEPIQEADIKEIKALYPKYPTCQELVQGKVVLIRQHSAFMECVRQVEEENKYKDMRGE